MNLHRLLAVACMAIGALSPHLQADEPETVVGTLAGEFSVDNKGAANYVIPLAVPPGINGLQPSLSVSYNSNGGNGPLGVGWNISTGFPEAITRGRSIYARDRYLDNVDFDQDDRLYLDGKLLLYVADIRPDGSYDYSSRVNGYGKPNTVYRTEVDSFALIEAVGTETYTQNTYETINNVPTIVSSEEVPYVTSFCYKGKDGTVMVFGKGQESSDAYHYGQIDQQLHRYKYDFDDLPAYSFALKSVIDPSGNKCVLEYSGEPGDYVLSKINYSYAGTEPTVSVEFIYDQNIVPNDRDNNTLRDDFSVSHLSNFSRSTKRRLDSIIVECTDGSYTNITSQYNLEYEYSKLSQRTRLKSLSAIGATSGGISHTIPPTIVDWESESMPEYNFSTNLAANLPGIPDKPDPQDLTASDFRAASENRIHYGDFNGDGCTDFLYAVYNSIIVYLGEKDGFSTGATWADNISDIKYIWPADIDGDGKQDLLLATEKIGEIKCLISNGNGFVSLSGAAGVPSLIHDNQQWISALDGFVRPYAERVDGPGGLSSRLSVADFNGDGRDDFLLHGFDGRIHVFYSQGRNGFPDGPKLVSAKGSPLVAVWESEWTGGLKYVCLYGSFYIRPMIGDFNGDGMMDYAWSERDGPRFNDFLNGSYSFSELTYLKVAVTQKNGDMLQSGISDFLATGNLGFSFGNQQNKVWYDDVIHFTLSGDFNGDGCTDFLVFNSSYEYEGSDEEINWRLLEGYDGGSGGYTSYQKYDVIPRYVTLPTGETVSSYYSAVKEFPKQYLGVTPSGDQLFQPSACYSKWDLSYPGFYKYVSQANPLAPVNMFVSDIDKDGRGDLVWKAVWDTEGRLLAEASRGWYVIYSRGEGFDYDHPALLMRADQISGAVQTIAFRDMNGDGIEDINIKTKTFTGDILESILSESYICESSFGSVIQGISNGLGSRIEIEYKAAKDPAVYSRGAPVSYPIREVLASNPVVSDVYKDLGGTFWTDTDGDGLHDPAEPYQDAYHFSYQYSGNRTDLSGRGSLGFHAFVTLDWQTLLFKYQFLAQSFPMTGLTKREQTYRAIPTYSGGGELIGYDLQPISSKDNDVVFDEVRSAPSDALWGTVFPFMSHSMELRWEDNTASRFTVDAEDPESLFSQYNSVYNTNKALAHSNIESYVWFDEQALNTLPETDLPEGFDDLPTNPPGAQDGTPVGFVEWVDAGTGSGGALADFDLPKKITYGNITRMRLDYSDDYTTDTRTSYFSPVQSNGYRTDLVEWTQVHSETPTDVCNSPITSYTYSSNGLPQTKSTDAGSTVTDTTNLKYPVTNANSALNTLESYTYTSYGQLEKTILTGNTVDPLYDLGTPITTYHVTEWDPTDRFPETVQDPYGHETSMEYDAWGRVVQVTDFNNQDTETDYDILGRVTKVSDNLRNLETTSVIEDTTGASGLMAAQTVALPANCAAYTTYANNHPDDPGLVIVSKYYTRVLADGAPPIITHYDRTGRQIRTIKEGYSGQATYTDTIYNKVGQVIAVSNPYLAGTSAAQIPWSVTEYDELGRVHKVTAPNGTVTTSTYIGRVTQVTVDATDRAPQTTTSYVNVKGETAKVWNADNVPSTISQTGTTTTQPSLEFILDGFGRMVETKTWQGGGDYVSIHAAYNALGNQTSLNDPDKGNWTYVYDALGRLRHQVDAVGNTTVLTYDTLSRQLSRTLTEAANGPVETTRWYYYDNTPDTQKQLVADPQHGWTGALQRETLTSYWAANPSDPLRNYTTETAYYYNRLGQMCLDLHHIDNKWYYRTQLFDSFGRPEHVDYFWRPPGMETDTSEDPYLWQSYGYTNTYDLEGYLTQVADTMGKIWWKADGTAAYDYADRPVSFFKGGSSANGLLTTHSYDPQTGLLEGISTAGGVVQDLGFDYDGLGNLAARTDSTTGRNLAEEFTYDSLNRLTQAAVGSRTLNYSYAINGNITGKDDVSNTPSGSYEYAATKVHAVTSACGYTMGYDANGNVNSRTGHGETWSFRWAGFDKPRWMGRRKVEADASVNTRGSAFLYGPDHMRKVHLEFDSFAGDNPANAPEHFTDKKVYVANGAVELDYENSVPSGSGQAWDLETVRVYIPAPGGNAGAAELKPNATAASQHKFLVYHYDHLGSIQNVTDWGTSAYAWDTPNNRRLLYSYEPWGQRRDPGDWTGPSTDPSNTLYTWAWDDPTTGANEDDPISRGFTGHEMLDDLGLVHMNGRIYDPLLGRFLSADILIQSPGNLQSYNRYSYVFNNPLRFVDPSGYQTKDEEEDNEKKKRELEAITESMMGRSLLDNLRGTSAIDRYNAGLSNQQQAAANATEQAGNASGGTATARNKLEKTSVSTDNSSNSDVEQSNRGSENSNDSTLEAVATRTVIIHMRQTVLIYYYKTGDRLWAPDELDMVIDLVNDFDEEWCVVLTSKAELEAALPSDLRPSGFDVIWNRSLYAYSYTGGLGQDGFTNFPIFSGWVQVAGPKPEGGYGWCPTSEINNAPLVRLAEVVGIDISRLQYIAYAERLIRINYE